MNYEDFKGRFSEIIKDPAGQADKATELLADMSTVFEGIDALTDKNNASEARIRELENTNQRLFLSITSTGNDDDTDGGDDDGEELTGVDAINNFWTNLEKGDQ